MFGEKYLIKKFGSPSENPEALPKAIILKGTRAGLQKDIAEELTVTAAKSIIKDLFSANTQQLATILDDKFTLLNKLLEAKLKARNTYIGCSLAFNGDIILEWKDEYGKISKESLESWYKIPPEQIAPILSPKLKKEIPQNKAFKDLGLSQEDAEILKKSGKKLKEIKKYVKTLRDLGITEKFGEFITKVSLWSIENWVKPLIQIGIIKPVKILKFLDNPNRSEDIEKIKKFILTLENIDFPQTKISQLLNTSDEPVKELEILEKNEYIKYLKTHGINEETAIKFFEKNIREPKSIIELISKVPYLGMSKDEEITRLLDSHNTADNYIKYLLKIIETCSRLTISSAETVKILRANNLQHVIHAVPKRLEELTRQGIDTHLAEFCATVTWDDLFYYKNIYRLKIYKITYTDNDALRLLSRWRYVDTAISVLKEIEKLSGENHFLPYELIDIATTDFPDTTYLPQVVNYFKTLKRIGLYGPDIKKFYELNQDAGQVIHFYQTIRTKDKNIPTTKIIKTLKLTDDANQALEWLTNENEKESLEKMATISLINQYSFTKTEARYALENLNKYSIKKIGENLEIFRYLNFESVKMHDDVVKLIAGLIALKVPKTEIDRLIWYDWDPKIAVEIDAYDKKHDFGLNKNYGEELKARAQALLFFIKQNPDPALIGLTSHIFRKTAQIHIYNVSSFLKEPALKLCQKALSFTKDPALALKIGRNLYLDGFNPDGTINQETFTQKLQELENLQKQLGKINIWENTNILLACANEIWDKGPHKGEYRFGRGNLEPSLQTSSGMQDEPPTGHVKKLQPEDNSSNSQLERHKLAILDQIVNIHSPPSFRFIFNGHGLEDGLYLQNNSSVRISSEELADTICRRQKNPALKSVDFAGEIYIWTSCISHNFLRNTIERIKAKNGIVPILIGPAEYGQYGFSPWNHSEELPETALGVGQRNITLDYALKHENDWNRADLSIYVPNNRGIPQQVVETKTKEKNTKIT